MADGKRRYKSDRKDYKISVKLSEKDMDILKAALKRTGMTAIFYTLRVVFQKKNVFPSFFHKKKTIKFNNIIPNYLCHST